MVVRSSRLNGIETLWIAGRSAGRMIHGVASTAAITEHQRGKQSLIPGGCSARLPVPLLFGHSKAKQTGIGEVVLLRKCSRQIYVRAALFDSEAADLAWRLIEAGEVRAFSVGAAHEGSHIQAEVDGVRFFDRWRLAEVSICRRGKNADCYFEIFGGGK
jgi:hypothetical protein